MSVLSSTMGKPHHVLSLVRLLHAANGRLPRKEVVRWMAPPLRRAEASHGIAAKVTGAEQTLGAARSLSIFVDDGDDIVLQSGVPSDPSQLGHWVHDRLASLDAFHPDAIMLKVFAWFVAQVERTGTYSSFLDVSAADLVNKIESSLNPERGPDDAKSFNTTKYPAWREWMEFVGLGQADIPHLPALMPIPRVAVARLLREHGTRHGYDCELAPDSVISALAARAPYLDRGDLYLAATKDLPPSPLVSRVLSDTLRQLHADRVVELRGAGDAPNATRLAASPGQTLSTVVSIVILSEREHGS